MKGEVKTEISKGFLKIYQKILFENLYWYINYTIKIISEGRSNLAKILQNNTCFINFAIINRYLIIVAILLKKER